MKEAVRLKLGNGAVLLLHEDHSNPSIAFRGSVRAGAAYGRPGIAEFTARLLLRGTKRRSAAKISDATEDLAAALAATNGMESVALEGRCTRETLKETLRIFIESLATPAFAPAELEKVRGEVTGDLRAQEDDTRRAATRRLLELVYPPSHPYHADPKGDARSAAKIQAKDARAFHAAHYGAAGMIVAFSGDLETETFRGLVAAAFERLDSGEPPNPVPTPKPSKPANAVIAMPHKSQADFVAGRVALARTHPDYQALNLATILFGRIGLYGRLGQKVRDDLGLAYYSFSSLEARLAGGHCLVSAGVNPKNLAQAVAAIRAEMERLRTEPFSDAEVRDGKTHLIGSLQVTLERNPENAAAIHDIEYYGLGNDYLERYPEIVRGLDPESVRKTGAEYYDPDASSWVASGPVKGVRLSF